MKDDGSTPRPPLRLRTIVARVLAGSPGSARRPLVGVFWTKLGDLHTLSASAPAARGSRNVHMEVHPEHEIKTRAVNQRFLRSVRAALPRACQPVIISDTGLPEPFFPELQRLGWDFVVRVRGRAGPPPGAAASARLVTVNRGWGRERWVLATSLTAETTNDAEIARLYTRWMES